MGSRPEQVTTGPDGNIWYTNSLSDTVGRITPGTGANVEFSAGITPGSQPYGITDGPDGNVWFTERSGDRIGRITPDGTVTEFSAGITAGAQLDGITTGPDGNLWFAEFNRDRIGRITPLGVVTEFNAGISSTAGPTGITTGPDGNIWFTEWGLTQIGRITPTGVVTEFSTGITAGGRPLDIATGADGDLWFTEFSGGRIGKIDVYGNVAEYSAGLDPYAYPTGIVAGPDGNMWFTEGSTEYIGRIDPLGAVTEYNGGATGSGLRGITSGPDGRIYFAENQADKIGILDQLDGVSFFPTNPSRLLDSRTPDGGWNAPLVAGAPRSLDVTGLSGIPEWATSVVMNVTVTDSTAGSFLTVYPEGTAAPNASNLNFAAGETIANHVTVRTGKNGRVRFSTAVGQTHVIADVMGYYGTGGMVGDQFIPLTPTRLLDSRTAVGGWPGKLGLGVGGKGVGLQIAKVGGIVDPQATAVVLNVTATNSDSGSYVTAWPSGQGAPSSSSLNFGAGQTIANLVTVKIGLNGSVQFRNQVGLTDLVVDVVGYYWPYAGDRYHALNRPTRVLDDRFDVGLPGPWGPSQSRILNVLSNSTGPTGIPAFARGLVMNATVTNASQGSFVTIYPWNASVPNSSNINFGPGQTIPNQVIVRIPPGGSGNISIYNHLGTVDVISDVAGYFASS